MRSLNGSFAESFIRRVLSPKQHKNPHETVNKAPKDSGGMDHVDLIFRRSLLLSKLFTQSWGSPKVLSTYV